MLKQFFELTRLGIGTATRQFTKPARAGCDITGRADGIRRNLGLVKKTKHRGKRYAAAQGNRRERPNFKAAESGSFALRDGRQIECWRGNWPTGLFVSDPQTWRGDSNHHPR